MDPTTFNTGLPLQIDWRADNHVFMTGPAVTVFDGEIDG
jgi:diaminopimelate epimerase